MKYLFTLSLFLIPAFCFSQKVYSVKYANQADIKVFVVKYENQADLKVYFVSYKNQAGWRNKNKSHLMY